MRSNKGNGSLLVSSVFYRQPRGQRTYQAGSCMAQFFRGPISEPSGSSQGRSGSSCGRRARGHQSIGCTLDDRTNPGIPLLVAGIKRGGRSCILVKTQTGVSYAEGQHRAKMSVSGGRTVSPNRRTLQNVCLITSVATCERASIRHSTPTCSAGGYTKTQELRLDASQYPP